MNTELLRPLAFIDFETANRNHMPFEIGMILNDSQKTQLTTQFDVNEDEWEMFHIGFNFGNGSTTGSRRRVECDVWSNFEEYCDTKHKLPTFDEFMKSHNDLMNSVQLMAWNASTEKSCFKKSGYEVSVFCVMQLARRIYGKRDTGFYKLANFARWLGIEVEEDKLHTAVYDAILCSEVYDIIKDRVEGGIDFNPRDHIELTRDVDTKSLIDFEGEVVCATGKFAQYSKGEIGAKIQELGGTWSENYKKNVTMLIVANTGIHGVTNKIKNALNDGVKILSADDVFLNH